MSKNITVLSATRGSRLEGSPALSRILAMTGLEKNCSNRLSRDSSLRTESVRPTRSATSPTSLALSSKTAAACPRASPAA